MMKEQKKKLVLKKREIAGLNGKEMELVLGGETNPEHTCTITISITSVHLFKESNASNCVSCAPSNIEICR